MKDSDNKPKPRIFELSLLNVVFCMLVVFIHISSKTISTLDKDRWQYLVVMIPWRLSAFVVQGFIFLSGLKLFLTKSKNINYGKFYINRLLYIILPYILWVFVYYIYFYRHNYFPFNLFDFFRYVFIGDLVSHFYFIIIITQFYLLTPLWIKLIKKFDNVILIILSLMITIILGRNLPDIITLFFTDFSFQYTDRIFTTYLIYWIAGCYAGLYYEKFKEILHKNRMLISITFLIVSLCNIILSYLTFSGKRNIYWLEDIHFMYCICAILFFFTIALLFVPQDNSNRERISKIKNRFIRLINSIDKISYEIYLSHCLLIFIIDDFLTRFPEMSLGGKYFIKLFTVYTITICILLLWNNIKKRIGSRVLNRVK